MSNKPGSTIKQSSKKRHCMVVHAFYPLAETRVQREAEALIANGYEVDLICIRFPNEPLEEVVRGVNVYRVPLKRNILLPGFAGRMLAYVLFLLVAMFRLMRTYGKRQYGVVQVHNLPDFLVFCAWWPKLRGAKIILDIHDVMPEFYAERTHRAMDSTFVKFIAWQEQISARFADHVVTVTEPWRQALIERGVPDEKSSVVMNCPDHNMFHRGVQPATTLKSDGNFHLIYHGVQAARHGLDGILRAVDQLRDEIPNLHVILHGDGDGHNDLVRLSRELNLTDRVHFSNDFMPIEDLPPFIAQADVGVVPYHDDIFSGGILPTKVLEYIALGLPVIAANTPAIQAYFDDKMIMRFEPGDIDALTKQIAALYHDKAKQASLIEESNRFNQRYNWATHSLEYVAVVDRLNAA